MTNPDLLVVGSGFFGLTVAERMAYRGFNVTVIERRDHIGGNAWSEKDPDTGIEIHKYGAHLFHTSNQRVWDYVNKYTKFTSYQHKVYANHHGSVYPLPINLGTINQLYDACMGPDDARRQIARDSESIFSPDDNLEAKAVSLVGRRLYDAFIREYTQKQWETDPRDLPAEIITRLPVRYNYDNRYFNDTYEGLPVDGYAAWIERMADSSRIEFSLQTDYLKNRETFSGIPTVYTGPIDEYFEFKHGRLSWRTLDFKQQTLDVADAQGCAVMNFSDHYVRPTRRIEFKHFHPERREVFEQPKTVIADEYSRLAVEGDEPYYPVNLSGDRELLIEYRKATERESGVFFGGRLGTYKYLDMHMAIASALTMVDNDLLPYFKVRT